jgi:hypothetical protein
MAYKVEWITDPAEALSFAKRLGKPVLLDFYNPN